MWFGVRGLWFYQQNPTHLRIGLMGELRLAISAMSLVEILGSHCDTQSNYGFDFTDRVILGRGRRRLASKKHHNDLKSNFIISLF